ncbi:hypothetical protein JCM17136A_27060 [Phocaeicola sartorii JCM 17136 = DSM 21941]
MVYGALVRPARPVHRVQNRDKRAPEGQESLLKKELIIENLKITKSQNEKTEMYPTRASHTAAMQLQRLQGGALSARIRVPGQNP